MKLFTSKDTLADKITFYHLAFFAASLPLDRYIGELILASFIIHSLIHIKTDEIKTLPVKKVLLLQGVFFVTLIATLYTSNLHQAFKEWEKQLAIFVFPLLLAVGPAGFNRYRLPILMALVFSCMACIAYLEWNVFATIRYYNLGSGELLSARFINWNFAAPLDIHPTFMAMYVALSLTLLLSLSFSATSGLVVKTASGVSAALLLFSLLQLGSKAVLISLLLLLVVVLMHSVIQRRKIQAFILIGLLITPVAFTLSSPAFRQRFITSLANDITTSKPRILTDENRMVRWRVALDLVAQKPLRGYGTGAELTVLKNEYFKRKLYSSFINDLNAHSQYLSFLIRAGLPGLLLYVLLLYNGFSIAVKRRDVQMLCFMLLIAVVSVSENILDVNKGIFFYSFFFSLFLFLPQGKKVNMAKRHSRVGSVRHFQVEKSSVGI